MRGTGAMALRGQKRNIGIKTCQSVTLSTTEVPILFAIKCQFLTENTERPPYNNNQPRLFKEIIAVYCENRGAACFQRQNIWRCLQ